MDQSLPIVSNSGNALPIQIAVHGVTKWPEGPTLDPHEIHAVYGWHCVGQTGAWGIDAIYRHLAGNLVHSHWNGAPVISDLSRKCLHLVFAAEQDLFIVVSEHTPGRSILRVWARSLESAETEFQKLRSAYYREERADEEDSYFLVLTIRDGEPDTRCSCS